MVSSKISKTVVAKPGSWYARHRIKKGRKAGKEYESTENFEFKHVPVNAGSLHLSLDLTLNLGDFNSANVGAGITLPVDPENLEAVYKLAWDFTECRIQELANKVRAIKDGNVIVKTKAPTLSGWTDIEFLPELAENQLKASVTANYSRRQNMQNFEGAKVTVILTMKTYPETIGDAWEFVEDFVKSKVDQEIEKILPESGGPVR